MRRTNNISNIKRLRSKRIQKSPIERIRDRHEITQMTREVNYYIDRVRFLTERAFWYLND